MSTRGQRSRPFTRGSSQSRPSSRSRPFTRSSHHNSSYTRSPHHNSSYTRSPHQGRPFNRGPRQSRPYSRGSYQTRPYNRNSSYSNDNGWDQSQNGSNYNFRGQSYDRGTRGSFRSTRGARGSFRMRGTRGSFRSTRGARGSFRSTRGAPYSFRGARTPFNPAEDQPTERTQGVKRKMSTSLTETAFKVPRKDNLERKERTLFVGNVPLETTELEMRKLFAPFGTVESVRFRSVPRADIRQMKKVALIKKHFHPNRNSMNSYVVFTKKEGAEKAQELNGTKFKDHCLRVNISTMTRPTNLKHSIFVGNLPFDIEDDDLIELFKDCGPIESVRVAREIDTAVGRGFGFVNFASGDGVELALQMENVQFEDRTLRIQRCDTKYEQLEGCEDWISVKIDHLPPTTTKAYLTKAFKECGEIINITFNIKSPSKKSAIIAFRTADDANNALNVQLVVKGRLAVIRKDPFDPHKHVFIRNVPLDAKNTHVKAALDQCGVIKACKLLLTPLPPYTAGFGIVEFDSVEGAQNALQLNTFKIMDNDITIESYIKEKPKVESAEDAKDDTDEKVDGKKKKKNKKKKKKKAKSDEEPDSEEIKQENDEELEQDDNEEMEQNDEVEPGDDDEMEDYDEIEDNNEENEEIDANVEQDDEDSALSDEDEDEEVDDENEEFEEEVEDEEELDEELEEEVEEEEIEVEDEDEDDV